MPAPLLDAVTVVAVLALLWAPATVALALLAAAVFLVPAPLLVPHMHSSYLTVLHVLVLAGVVRIVARRVDLSLPPAALRLTPVHAAWVGYVAVAFAVGVMFVVTAGPLLAAGVRLADLAAQVAFFVVVLALARQIGDLRVVVGVAAGAVLLSAGVAAGEHVTGDSLGHWLFARVPGAGVLDAAHPLGERGGQPRVRAGAEFALQYGWLVVTMLPVVVVAALRSRWRAVLTPAAVALTVVAVYWSYTRSALVAAGAVVVLLALVARERRTAVTAAAVVAAGALAVAAHPAFVTHVSAGIDTGSIAVRLHRVAPILDLVSAHPFRGLGLGELARSGFATTDNAFLLDYAEIGAVGVAMLVVLLVTVLGQAGRGLTRRAQPDDRLVAAGCVTGLVAWIAGAMFYDAFTLLQSALLLALLGAVGTVASERAGARLALPRPSPTVALNATVAAVGLGFAAFGLAPAHVAAQTLVLTLSPGQQVGPVDPISTGDILTGTVCAAADMTEQRWPGTRFDCRPDPLATGVAQVRIEAPSTQRFLDASTDFADLVHNRFGLPGITFVPATRLQAGRPSLLVTAPAWLPLLVLGGLTLVPWRRDRADRGRRAPPRTRARIRAGAAAVPASR